MKLKNMLVTLAFIISVVLLAGCGKSIEYIDGVAYTTASNIDYALVYRSDPEFESPVIAEEYKGMKVEEIAQDSFSDAVLTSIVIPESINYLSPDAFVDCHDLKEITIKGNPRLSDACFCRLDALETVTFGPSTESIPMEAFEDCNALRKIYVPAACKEITGDVPDEVTLILQSEELVEQAVKNGWNFQMEDGSAVASMTLAEAIEAGQIEWDNAAENPDGTIHICNVSKETLIVDWPDNYELKADDVTYYIPEGNTVTLKPSDSQQLEADYYTAYGPEEATVQIAAESDFLYCQLYKENNKRDTGLLVEPHARETLTLPCGRYSIKILRGKSAEEADPETAEDSDWGDAHVWGLEAGSSYEVCLNYQTNSYKLEEYGEYGPGKSSLYLRSDGRSTCYRLVRVGGELEQEVFLEPGQSQTVSFQSGRYKLRIAEGNTWLSDEEAFGEEGKYSVIDYFNYKEGKTYGITETTDSGNVYKGSAGGFVS